MLESLSLPAPPPILRLSQEFAADTRAGKIDLGIGVYRDDLGRTAVLDCVKAAEQRILADQQTKTYVGLQGDPEYCRAATELVLGDAVEPARIASVQTPGGSGALRLLFDLIKGAHPSATVWLPTPSWSNHVPTLRQAGLPSSSYRYFDEAGRNVDFDGMMEDLATVPRGDVVLLHGCCHNPTGADLSKEQWERVGSLLLERGLVPLVDLAYLGFGDELDGDAFAVRQLAATLPEVFVAVSFSKNFAIYRERTGLALVIAETETAAKAAAGTLKNLARGNYSMPPDHGAAIVRTVLCDPKLRAQWLGELRTMRERVASMRHELVTALQQQTGSNRFDYLARQAGMFSLLDIGPEAIKSLREDHAIYAIDDGRINVAGIQKSDIEPLAAAIAKVVGVRSRGANS